MHPALAFWSVGETAHALNNLTPQTRSKLRRYDGFGLDPKPIDNNEPHTWSDSLSRLWPLFTKSEQREINAAVDDAVIGMATAA